MRSHKHLDPATPAFTLICPGYQSSTAHSGAAGDPGRLTFTIGSDVVAEISHADLLESWQAASEMTATEAAMMTEMAAGHLADMLENGLTASDLTEAVTDAAVVLLLALRRKGIADPRRIPACTVMWNEHEGRERVFLGA